MAALQQAERLALIGRGRRTSLATVCGNQANVALMQHRHDAGVDAGRAQRRAAGAGRDAARPGRGAGVARADLRPARQPAVAPRQALNRALDVRSPLQFMRETTGAVFDTLAQIHLIRGEHEAAEPLPAEGARGLRRVRVADDALVSVVAAVLEARAGAAPRPARPGAWPSRRTSRESPDAPPAYVLQAELIAVEALLASGAAGSAQRRLDAIAGRIDPAAMSGTWGEFLRLRGRLHARGRARHRGVPRSRRRASACSSCSASAIRPG